MPQKAALIGFSTSVPFLPVARGTLYHSNCSLFVMDKGISQTPSKSGYFAHRGRRRNRNKRIDPSASASSTPLPWPGISWKPTPTALSSDSVAILWFRNDLRTRDNEALVLANSAEILVPVFVFDTSKFGMKNASPWGFQRNGPFRSLFLRESVKELQNNLRILGNDMIVRQGDPVDEIIDIARTLTDANFGPINVVAQKETTWEETQDEKRLQNGLKKLAEETGNAIEVHWVWGSTLHHLEDIEFEGDAPHLPATFSAYRKVVEGRKFKVRSDLGTPKSLQAFPLELMMRSDPYPSLRNDLKVEGLCDPMDWPYPHPLGVMDFKGGETAGLQRMKEYIWEIQGIRYYKEFRNESGKRECSSKFSAWLALGCVSVRTIYWEVHDYEKKVVANESTYWMVFELMTRDYFRWVSACAGTRLFGRNGYSGKGGDTGFDFDIDVSKVRAVHRMRLEKWIQGKTGAPYIDSSMRELAVTGFMSNRGRQNVASFLIHDLEFPDWRAGAEYFESVLIDNDVASNWSNWAYIAGVGSDARGGRRFNVVKQSMQYDADGWFIRRWCPELNAIPPPLIHEPHVVTADIMEDLDMKKNETYPDPIVPLPKVPEATRLEINKVREGLNGTAERSNGTAEGSNGTAEGSNGTAEGSNGM